MRRRLEHILALTLAGAVLMVANSCSRQDAFPQETSGEHSDSSGPVTVGIAFEHDTKTQINPDGISASWNNSDQVALWALTEDGTKYLDGQVFFVYGKDTGRTVFSSELASAMPQGTYTYFACYPVPQSVSGTNASFTLPDKQDGLASAGADIMASGILTSGPLQDFATAGSAGAMQMNMHHLVHLLKFYLPEGSGTLDGEAITRAEISMPTSIAGTFTVDLKDPLASVSTAGIEDGSIAVSEGKNKITITPQGGIKESTATERNYFCASILPSIFVNARAAREFTKIDVKLFSDSHFCKAVPISVEGRTFEAGHTSSAKLTLGQVEDLYELRFSLSANNLGESVRYITISSNSGKTICEGKSSFTYGDGSPIATGTDISFYFDDEDLFKALSGDTFNVVYQSEHIRIAQSVTLPAITTQKKVTSNISVPYLLNENFSSISTFSSNDAYATLSTGDMSGYSFLSGWSGGRIGGQAGNCVRTAARRETSARYHARLDSAPLNGEIIAPVNLKVSFDYGTNNKYGGIGGGNYGQTVFIGYTTETTVFSSGNTSGSFEDGNSFNTNDKNTDWTTPNHASYTLNDVSTGAIHRICWRAEVENHAGTNNTTCWCYLDNIVVTVDAQ